SPLANTAPTRPTTIEMTEKPVAEDDGVLRRERPSTLRADARLLFLPVPPWLSTASRDMIGAAISTPSFPANIARPLDEMPSGPDVSRQRTGSSRSRTRSRPDEARQTPCRA